MYEGGGTSDYPSVRVYVLFAAVGIADANTEVAADRFRKVAKHTNKEIGGETVDLGKDKRLEKALSITPAGIELYKRIWDAAPVICFSNHKIADTNHLDQVELLPFSDYINNIEALFDKIDAKLITAAGKAGFLEQIELLNEMILLRPSVFGLGIDLNKVISKFIADKRGKL